MTCRFGWYNVEPFRVFPNIEIIKTSDYLFISFVWLKASIEFEI